jgi:predicted phosphodiesterase
VNLWAISDLHVGHPLNRRVVEELNTHPDDWLVLCGDVGESLQQLEFVFATLGPRFRRLVWVPGNHELWSTRERRGVAKYEALVSLCREHGVLTPEDPYEVFVQGETSYLLAPLFTFYDYSYAPTGLAPMAAKAWAAEEGVMCADEYFLHTAPYDSRETWCASRCATTEKRLSDALSGNDMRSVLIGHFPLRAELAHLPAAPRFRIWCGTQRTRDWHRRFRAEVVVFGHTHMPQTCFIHGVRFEEVSLGYPHEWKRRPASKNLLRQILPRWDSGS